MAESETFPRTESVFLQQFLWSIFSWCLNYSSVGPERKDTATFVVNVTQSSYQAEENHNITLEWTFTTKPDVSWRFLFIICNLITDHRVFTLYHVHEGVEVPESQDGQFVGRVQSDKDVLREGRIRLHVSRLRTNDSGLYVCDVTTDYGFSSEKCQLNVTEAAEELPPQRPTIRPQPERGGHILLVLMVGCGVPAAVLLVIIVIIGFVVRKRKSRDKRVVESPTETILKHPIYHQPESEIHLKT
ncbi:uncharacterized protein LOC121639789 isoform X3 [Melanotaenia boesemani]|uniref:uncharacterized protein LOC121639789 isoform X3 n=1 Tax=Melanotaenia boesemani TaxID=1250792 RepID=UPI001C0468F0|nr:uncharacterized protein LOC121639789 isoform X3 [Melanotaenia boesemani]